MYTSPERPSAVGESTSTAITYSDHRRFLISSEGVLSSKAPTIFPNGMIDEATRQYYHTRLWLAYKTPSFTRNLLTCSASTSTNVPASLKMSVVLVARPSAQQPRRLKSKGGLFSREVSEWIHCIALETRLPQCTGKMFVPQRECKDL